MLSSGKKHTNEICCFEVYRKFKTWKEVAEKCGKEGKWKKKEGDEERGFKMK